MVNSECYKKIITMSVSVLFIVFLCVAMDENISYSDFGIIVLITVLVILIVIASYMLCKKYIQSMH